MRLWTTAAAIIKTMLLSLALGLILTVVIDATCKRKLLYKYKPEKVRLAVRAGAD